MPGMGMGILPDMKTKRQDHQCAARQNNLVVTRHSRHRVLQICNRKQRSQAWYDDLTALLLTKTELIWSLYLGWEFHGHMLQHYLADGWNQYQPFGHSFLHCIRAPLLRFNRTPCLQLRVARTDFQPIYSNEFQNPNITARGKPTRSKPVKALSFLSFPCGSLCPHTAAAGRHLKRWPAGKCHGRWSLVCTSKRRLWVWASYSHSQTGNKWFSRSTMLLLVVKSFWCS